MQRIAYKEDEYLQLSGIQHFIFCRRQWALIHIENLWSESALTASGRLMHENVHTEGTESRGACIKACALSVHSRSLGLSGQCDVVEFHRSDNGIPLQGREGLYTVFPVEYKHGDSSSLECDSAQLCAQAMCLEEMLCCDIPCGALYYGRTKHREAVTFTPELRQKVIDAVAEMHELFRRGHTPKVKPDKNCKSCSLNEICLPALLKSRSAKKYLEDSLCES